MKLIFTYIAILSTSIGVSAFGNAKVNLDHGVKMFNELRKQYPAHFKILNDEGDFVEITEQSNFGKFIISRFKEKNEIGNIYLYINKDLRAKNVFSLNAKTIFNMEENKIEIRLGDNFKNQNSNSSSFWKSLIFEFNNIQNTKLFADIDIITFNTDELLAKEFIKVEYQSILLTKNDYRNQWLKFCDDNKVTCNQRELFFKDGTSFESWYKGLKDSVGGRKYINYYASNHQGMKQLVVDLNSASKKENKQKESMKTDTRK